MFICFLLFVMLSTICFEDREDRGIFIAKSSMRKTNAVRNLSKTFFSFLVISPTHS